MNKLYKRAIILLIISITLVIGIWSKEPKEKIYPYNATEDDLKIHNVIEEEPPTEIITINTYKTRLTSYWVNDDCNSADMTASGKSSKDFQLNDKGWYTYNGKLVVATASYRLGRTNQRTYKLYEELTLIINGTSYEAIVLDVCGSCMIYNRIDLYVKDKQHMIDQQIEIVEE